MAGVCDRRRGGMICLPTAHLWAESDSARVLQSQKLSSVHTGGYFNDSQLNFLS